MENKEIKLKWLNEEIETKSNQITYYNDCKDKDLAKLVIELLCKDIDMLESIKQDYENKEDEKQILDEDEKIFLKNISRPFKYKIIYIKKTSDCETEMEYLHFHLIGGDDFYLPYFTKGTMYKKMEKEKEYSLQELGIEYE